MPGHRRGVDPHGDPRQPDRRHASKRGGRLLKVALLGGAVALLVSEDLRNQLLDVLFGAEEEFDYSSVTEPIVPGSETVADDGAPAGPAAAEPDADDAHDEASEPAPDDEPVSDPPPAARVSPSPSAWEHPPNDAPSKEAGDSDAPPSPPRDWWSPGEASPPPGASSDD